MAGFVVIGMLRGIEVIAAGNSIRELARLRRHYGPGHWRKKKAETVVRLDSGDIFDAEVHWYEAHGIGKVEMKIKRFLGG